MKKLLFICGLLWSVVASAQFTPFVPGQVLTAAELNNAFSFYAPLAGASFSGPVSGTTGSFSGLVSVAGLTATGTISLPTGSLPLPYLATQSANTVVANATGSAASPSALAVPSCSTTTSSLQWTSGTGFNCFTGSAPLASPTFTGTVTIPSGASISGFAPIASPTFTGSPTVPGYLTTASAATTYAPVASPTFTGTVTIPATASISQPNIIGVTTGTAAAAGSVGQIPTPVNLSTQAMTSGTALNCASVPLTAGVYLITGAARINAGTGAIIVSAIVGSSATSATRQGFPNETEIQTTFGASLVQVLPIPPVIVTTTTSSTEYLVVFASFSGGTATCDGNIAAFRIR